MSEQNIPVTPTIREQVLTLLDNYFENNKAFTIRSIHECFPQIKSTSTIFRYVSEWKKINKEAYDCRYRKFEPSNALSKLLINEVAVFVDEQHSKLNSALESANNETKHAIESVIATEEKYTLVEKQLISSQETISELKSKMDLLETKYGQQITVLNDASNAKDLEIKNLNEAIKQELLTSTRLEVKLDVSEQQSLLNAELNNKSIESLKALQKHSNEQSNNITKLREKLLAEEAIRSSMEQSLKRIPDLERSLAELPSLKDNVINQHAQISNLNEEIYLKSQELKEATKTIDELKKKSQSDLAAAKTTENKLSAENARLVKIQNNDAQVISQLNETIDANKQKTNKAPEVKNEPESDDIYEAYNELQNENNKLKTASVEQLTTIQELKKLIDKQQNNE